MKFRMTSAATAVSAGFVARSICPRSNMSGSSASVRRSVAPNVCRSSVPTLNLQTAVFSARCRRMSAGTPDAPWITSGHRLDLGEARQVDLGHRLGLQMHIANGNGERVTPALGGEAPGLAGVGHL